MEVLLLWLVFSVVAGIVAASRGRSGFGYFLLSIFLSPLVGLLLAALMPSLKAASAQTQDTTPRVPCPRCAELIMPTATVCRFCQAPIEHAPPPPPPASPAASPAAYGMGRALGKLMTSDKQHRYPPKE